MTYSRLLVVWIACLLSLQALAQSSSSSSSTGTSGPLNPSNGLPPVINRVSGCTDQGSVTVDCSLPVTLTLHGSGFMTGLEYEKYALLALDIVLDLPGFNPPVQCALTYVGVANDTILECTVYDRGYGFLPTQQMLPLVLSNKITKDQAPPFAGFSLKFEPAPVVTGVTGCRTNSPDGRTTYNCDLITDSITILGSGFTSIDRTAINLQFGHSGTTVYLGLSNAPLARYTDTEIVMSFATSYGLVAEVDLQDGKPIEISLRDFDQANPKWAVESVWAQFVDLPSPEPAGLTSLGFDQDCKFDNNTNRYFDCIPGLASLTLQGRYFLQGSVIYVGGQKANVMQFGNSNELTFSLPVFEYTNNVFYDVTITTVAGSATLPGVIEFSTDPVITDVVPCVDDGNNYDFAAGFQYARCMPGEKLILKTLNVRATGAPRVFLLNLNNASLNSECLDPVTVDSRTVQCTMPAPPPGAFWLYSLSKVHIEWSSGEKSNEVMVTSLWEPATAPRLTSISGCSSDSGSPLWLNQCLGQPDAPVILTLSGVRFIGGNWTVVIANWIVCGETLVVNDAMMTCVLPAMDAWLSYGNKYSLTMYDYATANGALVSNAAYITFVDHLAVTSPSSSSSSSTTTIAVATVFSVVGAILLVVAIVMISRKMSASKQQNSNAMAPEFSTTGNKHIELSEV